MIVSMADAMADDASAEKQKMPPDRESILCDIMRRRHFRHMH